MFTFRSLFIWMHVVTVVCWIGGIVFSAFVAGPVLTGKSALAGGSPFHERVVHRFQRLSRELFFLILITGIFNLVNRGIINGFNFSSTYLIVLGTKFSILLCIAGLQVYYSMKLIPRLSGLLEEGGMLGEVGALQKRAFMIACLMATLGASAIFMGLNLGFL